MIRHVLDDFVGHVDTVLDDNTFWAQIEDLNGDKEFVQILIEKLPPEEVSFVAPGAIFYWTFYNDGSYEFKFSREVWTQKQIEEIKKEAAQLSSLFTDAGKEE